ncbi:DUF1254 domain-containing protein [Oerskovia sp. M15]
MVRPNFDTLYANLWLDLTGGPVLLHVPDTDDRYYMLPLLDMWTEVFATIGKRTTGTGEGDYLIVGPDYEGDLSEFYDDLPEEVALIVAPTPYVWAIGRIQTNGTGDYPAVHAVQDGLGVRALGERRRTWSTRPQTPGPSRSGRSTPSARSTSSPTPPGCSTRTHRTPRTSRSWRASAPWGSCRGGVRP